MNMSILQNEITQIDTKVGLLADRVALEFRVVDAEIGPLTSLATTDKSNIVAALNEVKASSATPSNIDGGNF